MAFLSIRRLVKRVRKKWSISKRISIKRLALILILTLILCLSLLYAFLFSKLNQNLNRYHALSPNSLHMCSSINSDLLDLDKYIEENKLNFNRKINRPNSRNKISKKADSRILVFAESQYSRLGRSLNEFLESVKYKYDIEFSTAKLLPSLISQDRSKYSLIIFENYDRYLQLGKWNLNSLNRYCMKFNIGLIGFINGKEDRSKRIRQLRRSSLYVKTNVQIDNYHLNTNSKVLRISKAGSVHRTQMFKKNWTIFFFNPTNYKPIGLAYQSRNLVTTVVQDLGNVDGVEKILFGNDLSFWLHRLLLLDSISYLTKLKLSLPLKRNLQIDIDDIFVSEIGTRLKVKDVDALIEAQERIRSLVNGFKFNLGFSGKHFHKGRDEEDLGEDRLLANSDKFRWFCHTWSHAQPHLIQNRSILEAQMRHNKEFAQVHGIQIDETYSVAPHHSGVYPVHEALYDAWKKVYNIKVTSTEEYPHLRPARLRKGFIYKDIRVLPRQTCGLYTHTIFTDKYPGGKSKLDESIFGGEIFQTILFNPINIFMTHMSNYANDRIALYTFESALNFIKCWTNLRFNTIQPIELADRYFNLYADEKTPLWTNPCIDKRHLAIGSNNESCIKFPDFIIVGPQKTGTTALQTYLSLHPSVQSNYPTKEYFEELQFFNGQNYLNGIDWYLKKFPTRSKAIDKEIKNFEKSANYFDNIKVPERIHALLPHVKLVIILINPIKRAYSWYQHAKSHNDEAAKNYSFYDIITTDDQTLNHLTSNRTSPQLVKQLRILRNRSLYPGCYSTHLERWLQYFNEDQLIILDGEELITNPADVLSHLQLKLNLKPILDYNEHLQYVPKKGFFCPIINGNTNSNESNTDRLQISNQSSNMSSIYGFTNDNHTSSNDFKTVDSALNDLHNNTIILNGQVRCLGKSKGRVYPEIDRRSVEFLHRYYYAKCNTPLFKLLVRLKTRIPSWLVNELNDE